MFSFSFTSDTKADAVEALKTKLAASVEEEKADAKVLELAEVAAAAMIDQLSADKDVYVRISGSTNGEWSEDGTLKATRGVELTIHVG